MINLNIPTISCGHCVRAITEGVHALDPAAQVDVNIAARTAHISTTATQDAVIAKLAQEGYPATPA
ncbi:MAG: heavy-metal-associated domain-containing protein [Pseudomonadota bacterium]